MVHYIIKKKNLLYIYGSEMIIPDDVTAMMITSVPNWRVSGVTGFA